MADWGRRGTRGRVASVERMVRRVLMLMGSSREEAREVMCR